MSTERDRRRPTSEGGVMDDYARVRWDMLKAARLKCRRNVVEAERSGDTNRIHTAHKLSSFLAEALPGAWDAAEAKVPDAPPREFWREVPCGHPQDPLAVMTLGGWACHCGWTLDPGDAISDGANEGAPGPIVPCNKCGCYPSLASGGLGE